MGLEANPLAARAAAAARKVAKREGIDCEEPRILSDSSNVLVHLHPSPIVARVATKAALVRPNIAEAMKRELDVISFLDRKGAPVVAQSNEIVPGPHEEDGLTMGFFKYIKHDPNIKADLAEVSYTLGQLHTALNQYEGSLPYFAPVLGDIQRVLDQLAQSNKMSKDNIDILTNAFLELEPRLQDPEAKIQPLHGDVHSGNVLVTGHGLMWNDFEDTCIGPVAWDLACLTFKSTAARDIAIYHYQGADKIDEDELMPFIEARGLQTTVWLSFLAQSKPSYIEKANAYLGYWQRKARV